MSSLTLSHYEQMESYIPLSLLEIKGLGLAFVVILSFILIRYFLMVGGAYKLLRNSGEKVHDGKIPEGQISFEIKWSMVSSILFALSGVAMGILWQLGFSKIYLKFDEYSLWYLPISFIIYTLFHEVYFYFTHVWMHRPSIYNKVHAIHHRSVKTSPFASFSFHPYEALVHAVFLPLMVLIIPIHPVVVIAYLTFMTITAISNHLGRELISSKLIKDQFISGAHHSIHHTKMKFNFGLYYTFMDKVMGTEFSQINKKNSILENNGEIYE